MYVHSAAGVPGAVAPQRLPPGVRPGPHHGPPRPLSCPVSMPRVVARKARRFPPPMGSLSASSTFSTVRSLRVYRAAPHRGPNGSQFFTHPLRAHTISIPRSRCPRISFPGFSRSLTDSLSLPLCASLDHPLVLLKQTDTYRQTCSFSRADSFSRPRRISFLPALFPFLISLCFTVSPWRTCHRCAARRLLWVHTFPPL